MPNHIAITQTVRADCVALYEAALDEFARRSLIEHGAINMYCLHPSPGAASQEYGILRSFASEADQRAFYESSLYREWLLKIEPLVEGPATIRRLTGMEAWFRNDSAAMPPRWKMALLSWIGVWPLSMAVPAILQPFLESKLPAVLYAAAIAAGIVTLLTWFAMPLLTRLTRHWLLPAAKIAA